MFTAGAETFPGLVLGSRVFDLAERFASPNLSITTLLADWDEALARIGKLAAAVDNDPGDHELAALTVRTPLDGSGQVFHAAANYRQHVLDILAAADRRGDDSDGLAAEDRASTLRSLDERAKTGSPFVFIGSSHAMVGPNDDVVLPATHNQHDWELELAVVIGRRGRRLSREEALSVVAGYTICNDVTTRDALIRHDARTMGIDWLAGKNSPTFLPTGPFLVPATEVGDPMDLHLRLAVNGQVMQDESSADMLFDVAALVSYVSNVAELHPGDLVLTGSPAGNGASHGVFLAPGDVMEASITGLGTQRNRCIAED